MSNLKPNNRTLIFIAVTVVLNLAGGAVGAFFTLGWKGATATTMLINLLLLGWVLRERDTAVARLMVLGLVAGLVELLTADPFGVNIGSLVYYPGGPFLYETPLYMPFSWVNVVTQLGYAGWWAADRWGLLKASALLAVVGAINIPLYEWMARWAETWYYKPPVLFGAVPPYVILGELLIGAVIPFVAVSELRSTAVWTQLLGIALGLWMWIGGMIAYHLVG